MPKLVAIDLDGTLLTSGLRVSPDTVAAIAECESKGHRFAFCSGRNLLELDAVSSVMPYFHYAIIGTGAYIVDLRADSVMDARTIAVDTAVRLYRFMASRMDCMFEACFEDCVFVPAEYQPRLENYGIAGPLARMFRSTRTPTDDICGALVRYGRPPGKINLFFTSSRQMDLAMEATRCFDLTFCPQHPQNIEVNCVGVDKGSALARLAELIRCPDGDVIAIGDNTNDVPMLQFAGTGIAMGNALDDVKRAADFVTLSNDQEGVAAALRRCLN